MGYFELKKSGATLLSQKYYFVLKAGNGETIAQSEMYSSKQAALNGIQSVRNNAPTAPLRDNT